MRTWRAQGCGRGGQEYISRGRPGSHVAHVGLHRPCEPSEHQDECAVIEVKARGAKDSCLKTGGDSPDPSEAPLVVTHQTWAPSQED